MKSFPPKLYPNDSYPNSVHSEPLDVTCRACGHKVVLLGFGDRDLCWKSSTPNAPREIYVGWRRCPNTHCGQLVAVAYLMYSRNAPARLIGSWPGQSLNTTVSGLPTNIQDALDEAVSCFESSCYRASVIMVRRAIELVCEEHGAEGKDLRDRIVDLQKKVQFSNQVIDAIQAVRQLGNDAVHVELKHFDDIDKDHAEIAIRLLNSICVSLFESNDLGKSLAALKRKGQ